MTVEALLKQLKGELEEYRDDSITYAKNRDYHYGLGEYAIGLQYDMKRANSDNKAAEVVKIINEIEKRVS